MGETFVYLNVEPKSPIQAMSFLDSYLVVYFSIFKTIRSWKKNIKSGCCCGIRENKPVLINRPLQPTHYS
jgi:hypothetical protein